jgi:hypothetical protein
MKNLYCIVHSQHSYSCFFIYSHNLNICGAVNRAGQGDEQELEKEFVRFSQLCYLMVDWVDTY